MICLINDQIDRKKCLTFFEKNCFSTPFQSFDFYDFFNSIPNHKAYAFSIENKTEIKAFCIVTIQKEKGPKAFFTRRAIIYGGPIILENEGEALQELLKKINSTLKNKVIYFETRNLFDYSKYKKIFLEQNWQYTPYLNYQISTNNKTIESVIARMKYNRRREIRISIEEGANYEEATSLDQVNELYTILSNLYKTRVKLPLPNITYFENLYNSPVGKVFIISHNRKIIGGAFCLYSINKGIYTLYYCGLRDYNKKIFPTHLAILSSIDFALKNNLSIVDLMGAGKPSEKYSVRNYKAEFGGDLVEHGRFIKICNPFLYHLGILALNILRKLNR